MSEGVVLVLGEGLSRHQEALRDAGFAVRVLGTAAELFRDPVEHAICLLVEDVLPDGRGMDVLAGMASRGWTVPAILVTQRGDIRAAVDAVTAGAFDYVEQPLDEQWLIERVRQGAARQRETRALRVARAEAAERVGRLTPRERQVMELMVAGRSSKGIASHLKISERTIEVHRGRVMRKLEVDSVAQLMIVALRAGLVR